MIDIVVLSQPDCHFCDEAQAILARLTPSYPISIRQIALDSDQGRDLAARHGVMFAPGIVMNGRLVSYGRLSERRLRRHLDRHLADANILDRELDGSPTDTAV